MYKYIHLRFIYIDIFIYIYIYVYKFKGIQLCICSNTNRNFGVSVVSCRLYTSTCYFIDVSHAAFRLANPLGCPMGWRRFGHPMAAAAMAMASASRYATVGTLVPPLDAVGLSD